jgi:opacity protein-like surface antigen
VIRSLLIILAIITAPLLAVAQSHEKASNPGADHPFSISTGIGFASSVFTLTGFNWQLDAQYRLNDNVSVGGWMQVVSVPGAAIFSMTGDTRYHFDFLHSKGDGFLSKLTPYAGAGMGFSTAGGFSAFLFSMIGGLEYDLNERLALTSDMRFNILSGPDSFNFSWQMIGARYRF